jgi:hypothetical protein
VVEFAGLKVQHRTFEEGRAKIYAKQRNNGILHSPNDELGLLQ